jgi:phosphate transport system substrate-binding protein
MAVSRGFVGVLLSVGLALSVFVKEVGAHAAPRPDDTSPVVLEGSHTMFPLGRAIALAFQTAHPGLELVVGGSGTGLAFEQLCAGRSDLASASRPIKRDELDACAKNQVAFVEVPVAYDGVAVIVNPKNTWAKDITVAELQKLWGAAADKTITTWRQVRASWPDAPLVLFGPEVASGTTDYFRDALIGENGRMRSDYTATMNGETLVEGVSGSPNALGLLGLSFYKRNAMVLRALAVDDGQGGGPVAPTTEAIVAGTYRPLARPLLVYIAATSFERAPVKKLLDILMQKVEALTSQVGLVPLSERAYTLVKKRVARRTTGTMFDGTGAMDGRAIETLLGQKKP